MSEQVRFPLPKKAELNSVAGGRAPTIPVAPKPDVARSWSEDVQPKKSVAAIPENNIIKDLRIPPFLLKTKVFVFVLIGVFTLGLLFGLALSGGDKSSKPQQALLGNLLVPNPDIEKGLRRCGVAARTDRCVLYIMNSLRKEVKVSEMFPLAAQLTNIPSYRIQMDNIDYNSTIIKPGQFAQISVPGLSNQ